MTKFLLPGEINRIKNKSAFLVLHNIYESFDDVAEGIYQHIIIPNNIDPSQVILMSGSADILKSVKICAEKYNLPELKSTWFTLHEWYVKIERERNKTVLDQSITLTNKNYIKKFLNFNRRWRPHRPILVALFKSLGIIDKGHISIGDTIDKLNFNNSFSWLLEIVSDNEPITTLFKNNEDLIKNITPLYLDTNNLSTNLPSLKVDTKSYYEDTYFSVISETNFYTHNKTAINLTPRFFSEKTFKPIAMRHPFILVSVPKMLEKLKELGYKTFSPFIDESYDNELDDNARLYKIALETKRLSELNDTELQQFLENVRPIIEHNYQCLMSKTNFFYNLNF